MEIQVKIDPTCREPKVLVCTHAMTDEVQAILQALAQAPPQLLPGFREGTLELLEPQDLLRVYAAGGKVFAVTPAGEFQLRLRLYEAEARLDKTVFVRISHSEIINLRKAKALTCACPAPSRCGWPTGACPTSPGGTWPGSNNS